MYSNSINAPQGNTPSSAGQNPPFRSDKVAGRLTSKKGAGSLRAALPTEKVAHKPHQTLKYLYLSKSGIDTPSLKLRG
jgi:hypothetical protein